MIIIFVSCEIVIPVFLYCLTSSSCIIIFCLFVCLFGLFCLFILGSNIDTEDFSRGQILLNVCVCVGGGG